VVYRGGTNEPLLTKPDKSVALADTTCLRRHAVQLFSPNNRLTDNFIATVRYQVGEILCISCLHEIRHDDDDLHWVRDLTAPMHLGLINGPFVPHVRITGAL
jgi:hypothetical protein